MTTSFLRVIDDIPSCFDLYARVPRNDRRHVFAKVDRTPTAAEAMPRFQFAVNTFNARGGIDSVDADDVFAIIMMSIGIVVRRETGERATARNVDIVWFPEMPRTFFFTNEDIVAYVGDRPSL